jgi:transposase
VAPYQGQAWEGIPFLVLEHNCAPTPTCVDRKPEKKGESQMRIIGIDLAVTAKHRAIIAEQDGRFISPIIKFKTRLKELDDLLRRALRDTEPDCPLLVVMEATNIVWYPITAYFERRGATVYVVNPRMASDLARFYKRYAKSDRLSSKVLARLPIVSPDTLYPCVLSGADYLALQRGCKELERLTMQSSAIKNRLHASDHLGWPGLKQRVFPDPFSPTARWFREHFYPLQRVLEAGVEGLRRAWRASEEGDSDDEDWIEPLVELAQEVHLLYGGEPDVYVDYDALAAEVSREQQRLTRLESEAHYVRLQVTRPRYRQLHPSRNLETLKGVGQDGAAIYVGFIGDPARFSNNRVLRGWSGMVPRSAQSGESESKGLRITQAGPNLVKKYLYLNADVARQWDPQIAAIYHDQMVYKGQHHCQAVCACATHLIDRVRVVLTQDRPYELRDVDGTPVTSQQSRDIIAERYAVPEEVRRRNNRRMRRERAERRLERREQKRRNRFRQVRG